MRYFYNKNTHIVWVKKNKTDGRDIGIWLQILFPFNLKKKHETGSVKLVNRTSFQKGNL